MKKKNKQVIVVEPRSIIYSPIDMLLEQMKWEDYDKDKNKGNVK